MVLSVQKPNIPGLGKQTFGSKRTNTSSTAAQTLSSGVRPNAFSFSNISKQRWVPGQNTIKGRMDANFQNARARLNRPYTPPPIDYSQVPAYNNATAGSNKAFAWGLGLAVGASVLGGLVSAAGGGRAGSMVQQLGQAVGSLGGTPTATSLVTNSDVALSVSNMASCNDSASLLEAIDGAEGQLQSMEAMTPGLETQEATAQNNLNALSGLSSAAEKEKTTAQSGVSDCKNSVNSIKDKRDATFEQVKTGNQDYDNAVSNLSKKHDARVDAQNNRSRAEASATRADQAYTQAQNATQDAQAALETAQASGDPAQIAVAQARLNQAKIAENNAKDAKTRAENDLSNAKTAEQEAIEAENDASAAKQTAYNNLGDLQAKANEMEKALEQEQKKLDKAKENLLNANKNFDEAEQKFKDLQNQIASENSVVNLLKTHKNDVEALKDAIRSEKSRLSEIQKTEKKEDKNKAKLNNQNDS